MKPASLMRHSAPPMALDLPAGYLALHSAFGWQVPAQFNMAEVCCRRWARGAQTAQRVAIHSLDADGRVRQYTYAQLQEQADRLCGVLRAQGVERGARVAIVMPQRFETAVAYMAVLQMGAVAVPLSMLFGPQALAFRLHDSDATLAVADASALPVLAQVRAQCPALLSVLGVAGNVLDANTVALGADLDYADTVLAPPAGDAHASHTQAGRAATETDLAPTAADAPAVLIYTSGTTGNPKGALISHAALIGNLPGFVCSQNWFGFDPHQPGSVSAAVFWSPADWAWTGGLMDALLPTLYFGCAIVAARQRFDAQMALELMGRLRVTHTFLFPTAIKAMMKAFPGTQVGRVRQQFGLVLQACMSAGEAMGDAVFDYCVQQLGVVPNEMFGQTEINYVVGNSVLHWPARPGSMGMAYPGHRVAVIDADCRECGPGEVGEVAVHRYDTHGVADPVFFLGYWKNAAATREKFSGDWCRTGDLARRDAQGYFWYQGRADDVFKSAGYRIGPGEIENCLVKHAGVANAAVVPKPDAQRGALVKAYIVIAPEWLARHAGAQELPQLQAQLTAALQAHVRHLLAPYEYPKEIEYVTELPMTTTGKVQRRVLRLQEEARARDRAAPGI